MVGSNGEHLLQQRYATKRRAEAFYEHQVINFLNEEMKQFISLQNMVFISTADGNGECDSSFRAGEQGFVRVVEDKILCFPEYRGNGVMASLGNILENPHIGLLFIDFERGVGLHINGKAEIIENEQLSMKVREGLARELISYEGLRLERWVFIEIEEAYIHCSKHIPKFIAIAKDISWGTDDEIRKGGDYFKVKAMKARKVKLK